MNSSDYKREALEALRGRWRGVGLSVLVFYLISYIPIIAWAAMKAMGIILFIRELLIHNSTPKTVVELILGAVFMLLVLAVIVGILSVIFIAVMHVGFFGIFINTIKDYEYKPKVGHIFKGAKYFYKIIGLYFMISVFVSLWSLLLIIPGIVKAYSYSMAVFIMAENPEIGVLEAISKSREIMEGNKWRLFCLNFSFIGWMIIVGLCSIPPFVGRVTGFIALVCVSVYMYSAIARFYINISGQDYVIRKNNTDILFDQM